MQPAVILLPCMPFVDHSMHYPYSVYHVECVWQMRSIICTNYGQYFWVYVSKMSSDFIVFYIDVRICVEQVHLHVDTEKCVSTVQAKISYSESADK